MWHGRSFDMELSPFGESLSLPKTIAVVTKAGYRCPAIVTPENFMKEDLE